MLLEEDQEEIERERGPQHVSVLSPEYFAHGLDDPEYSVFEAANDAHIGDMEANGFALLDAFVEPYGALHTPTRTFATWRIPSMRQVLAILADDAAAQESMLDYWADFKIPFKSIIYSGPCLIEGTLFSEDNEPPEFYRQSFRMIEDATITHLTDPHAAPISVALGLINVFHIYGYSVEPA